MTSVTPIFDRLHRQHFGWDSDFIPTRTRVATWVKGVVVASVGSVLMFAFVMVTR